MKNQYFLMAFAVLLGISDVSAQRSENFERDYEPIQNELSNWDPVRGAWLSSSIVAIADQEPIPDRTFPENLTPYQMLSQVPTATLDRIASMTRANSTNTANPDAVFWSDIDNVMSRPGCTPVSGRSYGDPHLQSFDGARYSFQTVGEFTLAKSNDGRVEVQSRQKAQREDFSLNTAVAMNVGGDRVCIYAEDLPDNDMSTPVRVNGQSVNIGTRPFFLANGGTIRQTNSTYVIDWPTGESVSARVRRSGSMNFMNISFSVFPCTRGGYNGLMGNANGIESDDFNTTRGVAPVRTATVGIGGGSSEYLERTRLAFLAKEFAEDHRITQATSLFDYPIGTSTFTFTDRTFPRVHHTIDDLDRDRRAAARRHCENNGVSGRDLDGCIYDNGFLNLPPSRKPVIEDPSVGIRLPSVPGTVTNTNDNPYPVEKPVRGTIFDNEPEPIRTIDDPVRVGGDRDREDIEPVREPVREIEPEPVRSEPIQIFKPRTETPKPVITKPRSSTPRPSSPKPKPRSSTPVRGGRGL